MTRAINLQLFSSEKTEPASPRRRQMAREKGQIARSQDLVSAAAFFAGVVALRYGVKPVARFIMARSAVIWSAPVPAEFGVSYAMEVLRNVFTYAAIACAPVMAASLIFGAGVSMLQTGLQFRLSFLAPQLERLNPISGFARLFSRRAFVDCLKSLLKIGLIGFLAWTTFRTVMPEMAGLSIRELAGSLEITQKTIESLITRCGVFLLTAGLLDYLYQWWEHEKSLRMTIKEVRDELRDNEVKPEVRQAIRARMRQMARRRMMHEVPNADVVVVNPTHYAVALKYDAAESPAPVVVAKGVDEIALRIRQIAEEAGVSVVENPPLARALYKAADIGEMIPEELYKAVAEVLAYVYRLKGISPGERRAI
ncbi:MAG TPA: flagellar biosynthesis protein FlhB [Firmicutes bacterium]|nr:flagellar biosynthesis protein FlhB [Candidatus Fermentithermobacillaceae bacterium]